MYAGLKLPSHITVLFCVMAALASRLERDLLANRVSAKRAQQLAADSASSDAKVRRIGEAGASGTHSKNCKRDMMRKFSKDNEFPYDEVPCPMLDGKGNMAEVSVGVMFPHKVLQTLQHTFPMSMQRHTGYRTVSEFWEEHDTVNDPSLADSPMFDRPLWRQQAHAVVVHQDKVKYTSTTSLQCASWAFLQSVGPTLEQVFLLWIFPHVPATSCNLWRPCSSTTTSLPPTTTHPLLTRLIHHQHLARNRTT